MFHRILPLGLAVLLALGFSSRASAAEFSLQIGGAVATGAATFKSISFAVRPENCADPAKVTMKGVAEGLVNGERKSVTLVVTPVANNGVHAINPQWSSAGAWVVNVTGNCGDAVAAVVVPIGQNGFIRETAKFFPRAATKAEVEDSLKALAARGASDRR